MNIKPILFNTPMVQAILDGRKTQTRRLVKPHYKEFDAGFNVVTNAATGAFCYIEYYDVDERSNDRLLKPPYNIGDILWVRETWDELPVLPNGQSSGHKTHLYYKADGDLRPQQWRGNWKPSIHMPKQAARIFLQVTDLQPEHLKDITEQEALMEGFSADPLENGNTNINFMCSVDCLKGSARGKFAILWNTTIKKEELPNNGWDANPWVWVFTFERINQKPAGFFADRDTAAYADQPIFTPTV